MENVRQFYTKQEIAGLLELSIKTFYRRLRKHNIKYNRELIPRGQAKLIVNLICGEDVGLIL